MSTEKNVEKQPQPEQNNQQFSWGQPSEKVDLLNDKVGKADEFASDCNCSCFVAGSLVLMEDGTLKPIEQVKIGDKVWGLSGINTVVQLKRPILANRKLLEMADGSLRWSDEHPFWTSSPSGQQWWGSHDKLEWEREVSLGIFDGLKNSSPMMQLNRTGEKYAHIDGWKTMDVREVAADPYTQLYDVHTDGCHTAIVNGFLVGTGISDVDVNYASLRWHGLSNIQSVVSSTKKMLVQALVV